MRLLRKEFSNPGILDNVLPFFRLKGLRGIICSLPLTRPQSETCTGLAGIHWSCLVFAPWFSTSCSTPFYIDLLLEPGGGSVASRTVISLPVLAQDCDPCGASSCRIVPCQGKKQSASALMSITITSWATPRHTWLGVLSSRLRWPHANCGSPVTTPTIPRLNENVFDNSTRVCTGEMDAFKESLSSTLAALNSPSVV